MLYHAGLLDPDGSQSRCREWIARRGWNTPEFPDDVREDLAIWLAMPGFHIQYHVRNLRSSWSTIVAARRYLADFENLADMVTANWMSATRDDAIRLSKLRPGGQSSPIPLLCQLKILDDLKVGHTKASLARTYACSSRSIWTIQNQGLQWTGELPLGFRLLVTQR
ncbi:hypothetical protein [Novosphingobium decolorationis]|uniref:Uncharacterized protein n=1 Tax=Novosphingobium decolorationis TaxID=2698673 RepID=A0ABX8E8B8_9SPHN|nr:hypothetical protein [Novosphingobium decolorationis]QVM85252.1 hypothetical protein HT578_17535 [Novosphingobium decolorationis]